MKKSELLESLKGEFNVVGEPEIQETKMEIKTYDVPVFKVLESGEATKTTVSFYVKNEGEESEEVFLRQLAVVDLFLPKVNAKIESEIAENKIICGLVVENNNLKKFAIVSAFVPESETAKKVNFLYYEQNAEIIVKQLA